MTRTFIQTQEFLKAWEHLGFDDDDLRRLEFSIMTDPEAGSVMRGTGGLRKIRFARENAGKSGGARICYVDFVMKETVYLITAYSKNEKENLTRSQCNDIKKMIEKLEKYL